jgi:hypothetical protein
MTRTKTDWTLKPAEDIVTMFSMFPKAKTAVEVCKEIGLYKLSRIHRALWSLEDTGMLLVYRNEGNFKVYRKFDVGW